MVQDGPVLLHMQVQLLGEAAAGRAPFQSPQHSWKQLGTGECGGWGYKPMRAPIQPCPGGGEGTGHRAQALSTEEIWKLSWSGVPRLWEFPAQQR